MTQPQNILGESPGDHFLYLPTNNSMVNIERIALITFDGPPEQPSCTVHLEGHIPPLNLHGKDVERLTEVLHLDFQAIQTDLQKTQTAQIPPAKEL